MEEDVTKKEIDLVYEDDLLPVMEKLGIKSDFTSGKIRCSLCNKTVTQENLYALYEENGVKMICSDENCVKSFSKK